MIIGISEGDRYRFEIVLMSHGFIVRARTLESGEIITSKDRLFRTAPAAFAFAEMSAMKDAEVSAPRSSIEAYEAHIATDRAAKVFDSIRSRLADSGVSAVLLAAWDRNAAVAREPLMN